MCPYPTLNIHLLHPKPGVRLPAGFWATRTCVDIALLIAVLGSDLTACPSPLGASFWQFPKSLPALSFFNWMLYNVVLVSAAQQSESAKCIHMSPPPRPPPLSLSPTAPSQASRLFLTFYFVLGYNQLTMCDSFRRNSGGTQGPSPTYTCIHSPPNQLLMNLLV